MRGRAIDETIIFRASSEDRAAIAEASEKFKLSRSEISRRAIRLGLEALDESGIPGATVKLKKLGAQTARG